MMSPTQLQQRASDPSRSVWVAANAGSGKTKVLVDRVLRLLLDGVWPGHILCLTYTKAAAAEMRLRVTKRTRDWAVMEHDALVCDVASLIGYAPPPEMLMRAQQICVVLMDATPPLRIMTIHAFCQQVIGQFPFEVGIAPHVDVVDEHTAQLLAEQARLRLYDLAQEEGGDALSAALDVMVASMKEGYFVEILRDISNNQDDLWPLVASSAMLEQSVSVLYHTAPVDRGTDSDRLMHDYLHLETEVRRNELRAYVGMLAISDSSTDIALRCTIEAYLAVQHSSEAAYALMDGVLTIKGTPKAPTKKVVQAQPDVAESFAAFQRACEECRRAIDTLEALQRSEALLVVAHYYLASYTLVKMQHHVLDYNDLIVRTLALLEDPQLGPWVLFKLDGRVSHILLDEAQDTSDSQWRIVRALTEEFFSGDSAAEGGRSLFVVGDEKQSIYGFQGAAPRAFEQQYRYYAQQCEQAGVAFERVPMQTSFRSATSVLALVDAVFASDEAHDAVTSVGDVITHYAYRDTVSGSVTLYPPVQASRYKVAQWQPVDAQAREPSGPDRLAQQVADMVADWLREGRILAETGTPIQPGDILILLQSRATLVDPLMRALKAHSVPVAGRDRLQPSQHLAVRDVLALCQFLLDSGDDMALACVLVSPLYNVQYHEITRLSAGRDGMTLWQVMKADGACAAMADELEGFQRNVSHASLYRFFSELLYTHGLLTRFCARMGDDVREPLANFLLRCEAFEAAHPVSLQGFVDWMQRDTTEIKREMGHDDNLVRIMTVHGAKGLEAPVVILPDTMKVPSSAKERLLPFEDDERATMLFKSGKAGRRGAAIEAALAQQMDNARDESLRLLYVALTRASDELHVMGHMRTGAKKVPDACWYLHVQRAMETLNAQPLDGSDVPVLRYCQHDDLIATEAAADERNVQQVDVSHLLTQNVHDAVPFAFRNPSTARGNVAHISRGTAGGALHVDDTPLYVPSSQDIGTLVHACLYYQCNRSMDDFMADLPVLLARLGAHVTAADRAAALRHIQALAESPQCCVLLQQAAMAEISLVGWHGDVPLSGQIDRLIVNDNSVKVIDVKTGRYDAAHVAAYQQQMLDYKALVHQAMPDKSVELVLLFTQPEGIIHNIVE